MGILDSLRWFVERAESWDIEFSRSKLLSAANSPERDRLLGRLVWSLGPNVEEGLPASRRCRRVGKTIKLLGRFPCANRDPLLYNYDSIDEASPMDLVTSCSFPGSHHRNGCTYITSDFDRRVPSRDFISASANLK